MRIELDTLLENEIIDSGKITEVYLDNKKIWKGISDDVYTLAENYSFVSFRKDIEEGFNKPAYVINVNMNESKTQVVAPKKDVIHFGIPESDKYQIETRDDIKKILKYIDKVPESEREILLKNIKKRAAELNMKLEDDDKEEESESESEDKDDEDDEEELNESSSAFKKAYKNENGEIDDYLDGKAIARVKDPDERARLIAMKKIEKKGKLGERTPASDELARYEKQAQQDYDKKAASYTTKKDNLNEDEDFDSVADILDIMNEEDSLNESLNSIKEKKAWRLLVKSVKYIDLDSFDKVFPEKADISKDAKIEYLKNKLKSLPDDSKKVIVKKAIKEIYEAKNKFLAKKIDARHEARYGGAIASSAGAALGGGLSSITAGVVTNNILSGVLCGLGGIVAGAIVGAIGSTIAADVKYIDYKRSVKRELAVKTQEEILREIANESEQSKTESTNAIKAIPNLA